MKLCVLFYFLWMFSVEREATFFMQFLLLTLFLCLFAPVLTIEEKRWLENGMPNKNYKGPKPPVRAVLSSVIGCPCKDFPGVNDFLNSGTNFKYNMDVRYHPGRPEIAFYIDAVQQAPSIDLGRVTYDDLIELLEDAGVPLVSITKTSSTGEQDEVGKDEEY